VTRCETEVDLRKLSSLKIGGTAVAVYYPKTIDELASLVAQLKENQHEFYVIGKGSNVIFSSERLETPLICTTKLNRCGFADSSSELAGIFKEKISQLGDDKQAYKLLYAECGALNTKLIRLTLEAGVGDITCLSGVPGTFGGALAMNAEGIMDCMKGNMWIAEVNKESGQVAVKPSDAYSYCYRYSSVQKTIAGSALLRLYPADAEEMRARLREILTKRKKTQPLDLPSPGSAFKNPKGDYAGRLLDLAGMKGFRYGNVAFSEKHANFIVNLGNATSHDALKLMAIGKETVYKKFGIWLVPEVKFIGKFDEELLAFVRDMGDE